MLKYTLITLFSFSIIFSKAQKNSDSLSNGFKIYIPGYTFFKKKEIGKGIIFTVLPVGLISLGCTIDHKINSNTSSAYRNYPLLLGMQSYYVYSLDNLIDNLKYGKSIAPKFQYDSISFKNVIKAPFQKKNIFTPITGILSLFAIGELSLSYFSTHQTIQNVNQIEFFDKYINKNKALSFYGLTSLGVSVGAGTVEEYLFRNTLMPIIDFKKGQKKGLIYSSLIFGGSHAINLFFSKHPNYTAAALQVTEASILGYLLGRDVQKRGYKIGPSIAAHTIYDLLLTTGSFLIDPKNNFIGVNMKYKL